MYILPFARKMVDNLADFSINNQKDFATILNEPKDLDKLFFAIKTLFPIKVLQKLSDEEDYMKQEELLTLLALQLTFNED